MERLQIRRLAFLTWVGLLAASPAWSAEADDFRASVSANATLTFTNNVNLAPPGQTQADELLGLSIPLALRREGARVKLEADYIPTVYLYARTRESDNLQNNLRSLLSVEAIDEYFFVDASANIYQSYISPFLPRPEGGAGVTQNRTQQTVLGLSPYVRHQTSTGWRYLIRNDNYWNAYSAGGLGNSFTTSLFADIESAPARLYYGFDYTYLYSRDENQPTAYYQQVVRARPILTVTAKLRLSARVGYEANDYVTHYSGAVYGAGIDWAPTPRTKLDGFFEHRFFGVSYGLNFNHRTRLTAWRLSGTRNTYTTLNQPVALQPGATATVLDGAFASQSPEAGQRQQAVNQFLERVGLPATLTQPYSFYTNQTYVSEQWSGSVGLVGKRNTAELTLFWQTNVPVTSSGTVSPVVFAGSSPFRQQGVTLTFTHTLSALLNAAASARRVYATQTDPVAPFQSTENGLVLSLNRQLSHKTNGSLGVRWTNLSATINPYQETAVFAVLAHTF